MIANNLSPTIKYHQHRWLRVIPLLGIMLLSATVYMWKLWDEGLGNLYYAAGVKSMGQNFHAFFFNSLDSVGFVSVDKPPLGFWIQVLFTKIFGYTGIALLLPQAIASIITIYLLYRFMERRFGSYVAIYASLVLSLTPIMVAVSRNNTIDAILILLMVVASGQAIQAAEKSSMRHLILAGVWIGLAFHVKMLQAYMVVPAIYVTYVLISQGTIWRRVTHVAISVVVMLVISFSWMTIVDLTPKNDRPYVGSSSTNSAFDLAFGYNGLNRVFHSGNDGNALPNVGNNMPDRNRLTPPAGQINNGQQQPMNGSEGGEAGHTSIVRIFNSSNAGQIAWFVLPAFVISIYLIYLVFRRKQSEDPKLAIYTFAAASFLPMFIYFSFSSGLAHRYYFATLSPSIALLLGIGIYLMNSLQVKRKYAWPVAIGIIGAIQIYIHQLYDDWLAIAVPIGITFLIVMLLFSVIAIRMQWKYSIQFILSMSLFILPAIWSFSPLVYGSNAQLPIAGPELHNQLNAFNQDEDYSTVIEYLQQNRNNAKYLVAVSSAMSGGSELIIQSGEPVMVLGGFNGGDSVVTIDQFLEMVKVGEVRFALLQTRGPGDGLGTSNIGTQTNAENQPPPANGPFGMPGGTGPRMQNQEIENWIMEHGERVELDGVNSRFVLYSLSK